MTCPGHIDHKVRIASYPYKMENCICNEDVGPAREQASRQTGKCECLEFELCKLNQSTTYKTPLS